MLYPEPKRGMHSELKNSTENFDKADLSRARKVNRSLPDLAKKVMAVAILYPDTEKGGRGNTGEARKVSESGQVSREVEIFHNRNSIRLMYLMPEK